MPQAILTLSQWETRVSDVYSSARSFKSTQAELLARVDRLINAELQRKHGKRAVYPAWVQGYVSGLQSAHRAHQSRNDLEFCYVVDGVLYSTHADSSHLTTRHYCDKVNPENGGALLCRDETARGLFWRGTNKRYF